MFTILNSIKTDIRRDIKSTEREWKNNPNNDYYYAEISGLRLSLIHI